MSALRRLAGYLVLATVVPIAILLVLEGLASMGIMAHRALAVQPPAKPQYTVPDSLLGWTGRPDVAVPDAYGAGLSLTHDAAGLRVHRRIAGATSAAERRIVCSGGSLVHGAGVADSQTMCAYLERDLPGARTLEMAQEGFGIDQAYLAYRRDGVSAANRLHVFAFTRGDLDRIGLRSDHGYARPVLDLRSGRLVVSELPGPRSRAWSRWSAIASLLSESRLAQAIERRTGIAEATRRREADHSLAVAQALFRDLDSLDRARGSRLVLVCLPTLADLREGAGDDRRGAVAAFAARAGIPFVDLTAGMRDVAPDTADWFFVTAGALPVRGLAGHYSASGNRWVAARLAERLGAMPELASIAGAEP
jgi:hypothetical protein